MIYPLTCFPSYLGFNRLTGAIPSGFGNISSLLHISLENNFLSGILPTDLLSSDALNYLNVANNQLEGFLTFSSDSVLEYLDISGNEFTGISGARNIRTFHAQRNLLGSFPGLLQKLYDVYVLCKQL